MRNEFKLIIIVIILIILMIIAKLIRVLIIIIYKFIISGVVYDDFNIKKSIAPCFFIKIQER